MQPRLAAITGRLKGGTFTIDEASLVIGRETAANLCVFERTEIAIDVHDHIVEVVTGRRCFVER